MELRSLDQIAKREIAASLGEVLCKHFVNAKGEEITFDENEIKNARKEDLAMMLRDAIYDIAGIKEGDAIIPVDDPDLTGEGGEEGKYVDSARLSKETLHLFNLIVKADTDGNGQCVEAEPEKAKAKVQSAKIADKIAKKEEREAKKAQLAIEAAERKREAKEAKEAKRAEKEAERARAKEAARAAREQARLESKRAKQTGLYVPPRREVGMNRMQSVLLAIAELGVFATVEEVAIASDRIYLAANPRKFSNLKEPAGIARWLIIALLATSFLRMEGGQYIVQGKLTDDILALKK